MDIYIIFLYAIIIIGIVIHISDYFFDIFK